MEQIQRSGIGIDGDLIKTWISTYGHSIMSIASHFRTGI